MTTTTSSIKNLLERHTAPEVFQDEEATDYLCNVLSDAFENDDNEGNAEETAREVLSQFIDDESAVDAIVAGLLLAEHKDSTPSPSSSNKAPSVSSVASITPSRLLAATTEAKEPAADEGRPSEQRANDNLNDNTNKAQEKEQRKAERRRRREEKSKNRRKQGNSRSPVRGGSHSGSGSDEEAAAARTKKEQFERMADEELDACDDFASAWGDGSESLWGGRGRGGRGVNGMSNTAANIHLDNVTLTFGGNELLQSSTLQITGGHRYGLVGRNGVGKSTLLRRLAQKAIPGFPRDVRVLLVRQQVEGSTTQTALQTLLEADQTRTLLLAEQEKLEQRMDDATGGKAADAQELAVLAERLADVSAELDAMDADSAEQRAIQILQGLQFTQDMIHHDPTANLSGGWRMRLALARALFVPCDLLLLDEPTNHLDLHALLWLTNYLSNDTDTNRTLIVVSHDRAFLDICSDIMVLEHCKLKYHVGNYSQYEVQMQERAARQAQILDASERQRAKAMAFVEKQAALSSKKSADPKKQRQAKMIKEKKLDRIGAHREDGKRYKNFSLKSLSEDSLRLAEKVVVEADDPVIRLKIPHPTWPPAMTEGTPLLRLENLSFSYSSKSSIPADVPLLLNHITLNVTRKSKVAVVGRNGAGKSTLLQLLTGELDNNNDEANQHYKSGSVWRHPNLRMGHVTQHHVEALDAYASQTVMEYAHDALSRQSSGGDVTVEDDRRKIADTSGTLRQYLGSFGLGGQHAHRLIGNLSGGERMRLCFAVVLASEPHLLILDEPTNHLDMETLDALAEGLDRFEGAIVIVSHNQSFLCGFCRELWVVQEGRVDIRYGNHSDEESFSDIFTAYRDGALAKDFHRGMQQRSAVRQNKAENARRAVEQRKGGGQRQTAHML